MTLLLLAVSGFLFLFQSQKRRTSLRERDMRTFRRRTQDRPNFHRITITRYNFR